jgi:hypothetical protein
MTRQQWNDLDDTRQGRTTKSQLQQKIADQDLAAEQARQKATSDEEAFQKSMPTMDKLQRLGLTQADWRTLSPDKRGQMLTQLQAIEEQDRERERQASMSWREKNPEISTAIPWLSSAAWGTIPYINRVRAQGAANVFNRAAAENVVKGERAILGDPAQGIAPNLFAGKAGLERAKEARRLANTRGVAQPATLPYWVPASAGAFASTLPEDIDLGQKFGTPYQDASFNRMFSLPTLERMGLAAAASHVGREIGDWAPVQKAVPFPKEQVNPFIRTYDKFYKDRAAAAAAGTAAPVDLMLQPQTSSGVRRRAAPQGTAGKRSRSAKTPPETPTSESE